MNREELQQYIALNCIFEKDCERVCKEMTRFNGEFSEVWKFYLDSDTVFCEGGYSCMGDWCEISESLPSELLTYSKEELTEYVDNLIKKREEEKQRELERKEKVLREQYLKEYQRLKEKLGL